MRFLGSVTRRDKESNRTHTVLFSEFASEFKTDQCSQAVPEEGKRFVQEWE